MTLPTKQYIHVNPCLSKRIHEIDLIGHIRGVEQIERGIALGRGKIRSHVQKWGNINNIENRDN